MKNIFFLIYRFLTAACVYLNAFKRNKQKYWIF